MSKYVLDLSERVVSSFAFGMLAVTGAVSADLTDGRVWLGGALAGAASVVKALAGRFTGDKEEASLIK